MISYGELYTNVMAKLRFEFNIDESNITISVQNEGIITLGGKVKSHTEKYLAEKAVEKVEGVKGIANELMVDLALAYKRSDTEIVQAALNALQWTIFVPHEQIKVAVDNGHLTLSGEVSNNYQKQEAQKAIRNLYGITYITNNINVQPNVTPVAVKAKIIKEFERNARIDANNVQVEIQGDSVILKGNVRNFDELKEAKTAAWSIPGVRNVIDHMNIGLF